MTRTYGPPFCRLALIVGLVCLPVGVMAVEPEDCARSGTGFGHQGLTRLSADVLRDPGGGHCQSNQLRASPPVLDFWP